MKDSIPYPQRKSWMHERIELPQIPLSEKLERWKRQEFGQKVFESIASRTLHFFRRLGVLNRDVAYRVFQRITYVYFRIVNQLKVFGKENIPKNGCIFYVNHPGAYDPLILVASTPYYARMGALVSWNQGWLMDTLESLYGYISRRQGDNRYNVVEKMVRQILTKNRNFAIWPEGHPNGTGIVEQGFSSIVRVYSVVNCDKDRIPFIPVLIRGGGIYLHKPGIHYGPVEIHFQKPFFLNRDWLRRPEEGGKTPREIIDFMMLKIANKQKQKRLAVNLNLEGKKRMFDNNEFPRHMWHHFHHIHHELSYRDNFINNIYKTPTYPEQLTAKQQAIEYNTLTNYLNSDNSIVKVTDFHSEYKYLVEFQCKCVNKNRILKINAHKLVFEEEIPHDVMFCICSECSEKYTFIFDISAFFKKRKTKN